MNEYFNFISSIPNCKKALYENSISIEQYQTFIKPLKLKDDAVNLKELRMVKTPSELKKLQESADIVVNTIN
jgi:Xaa-Pro aminopeptidase